MRRAESSPNQPTAPTTYTKVQLGDRPGSSAHGVRRMNALRARGCAAGHAACGRWRHVLDAPGPHRDRAMMLPVAGVAKRRCGTSAAMEPLAASFRAVAGRPISGESRSAFYLRRDRRLSSLSKRIFGGTSDLEPSTARRHRQIHSSVSSERMPTLSLLRELSSKIIDNDLLSQQPARESRCARAHFHGLLHGRHALISIWKYVCFDNLQSGIIEVYAQFTGLLLHRTDERTAPLGKQFRPGLCEAHDRRPTTPAGSPVLCRDSARDRRPSLRALLRTRRDERAVRSPRRSRRAPRRRWL